MPDACVDLVLADPPYNIGVQTVKNGKNITNAWDKIENYIPWSIAWLQECQRVLKPNGVLYFWHNDMAQVAQLLEAIRAHTDLELVSFCIWDKTDAYRAQTWHHRRPDGAAALRSWFNICEYCLHFFVAPKSADQKWNHTGLERINSNPECYRPLKEWYAREKERLGLTDRDIARAYEKATGKKPYMLRHYFRDSQFEIPTKEVWDQVYAPLGFRYIPHDSGGGYNGVEEDYERMRQDYEALRQDYEKMRQSYEELRNYHRCDDMHCNVWHEPPIPSNNRYHTCQKPVSLLERMIRVSSRPGAVVLDPFMGSGSTGVAAVRSGRKFIGIEINKKYVDIAKQRIGEEK